MVRRDTPRPPQAVGTKGSGVNHRYGSAGAASRPLQESKALPEIEIGELRRLAEEGEASGLSEEDGEAVLDRLEAEYRSLAARKPRI
jgi:hypothetical protein